jgi:hypothetical protein
VDEDGRQFYGECSGFDRRLCSGFVHDTVLPQLGSCFKRPTSVRLVQGETEVARALRQIAAEYPAARRQRTNAIAATCRSRPGVTLTSASAPICHAQPVSALRPAEHARKATIDAAATIHGGARAKIDDCRA